MILLAEPPLQALIMINSSMMESLILGLPDWTTKTSFSRTLVKIRTLVSPLKTSVLVASREAPTAETRKQKKAESAREELEEAHIGELGQVCIGWVHAQVLTDLGCENRARIARKNERVAHC